MVGLGELLARLERRRQLLAAEGLFAAELKRPLPFLPGTVGLVTAPNSAAERDVLENARRRWPAVAFEVAYAAMQGPRAATEVIEALERLDRAAHVDVIVIARGGGSVEDLLPFSDEAMVRAVHRARTPVVSAIGHEPDSPLLDLVADLRASTPTDAAKLVVPDVAEELRLVDVARDRMRASLSGWVAREQAALDALRSRPALADPRSLLDARGEEVAHLRDRARRCVGHALDRAADDVGHLRDRARALSPLATLQRGYAVLQDAEGHVVTSVHGVGTGAPVSVRVADGRVHATTTRLEPLDSPDPEPDPDPGPAREPAAPGPEDPDA
jgi:exodeoxyribonuclease VII large subunit